jgi:hypothetical protein
MVSLFFQHFEEPNSPLGVLKFFAKIQIFTQKKGLNEIVQPFSYIDNITKTILCQYFLVIRQLPELHPQQAQILQQLDDLLFSQAQK